MPAESRLVMSEKQWLPVELLVCEVIVYRWKFIRRVLVNFASMSHNDSEFSRVPSQNACCVEQSSVHYFLTIVRGSVFLDFLASILLLSEEYKLVTRHRQFCFRCWASSNLLTLARLCGMAKVEQGDIQPVGVALVHFHNIPAVVHHCHDILARELGLCVLKDVEASYNNTARRQ